MGDGVDGTHGGWCWEDTMIVFLVVGIQVSRRSIRKKGTLRRRKQLGHNVKWNEVTRQCYVAVLS